MDRLFANEKLRFNVSCCLILLVVLFLVISLINDSISRAMSTAWNGTSVASNFAGGNGSSASPYLISNGEELAFFKSVIIKRARHAPFPSSRAFCYCIWIYS